MSLKINTILYAASNETQRNETQRNETKYGNHETEAASLFAGDSYLRRHLHITLDVTDRDQSMECQCKYS